MVSPTNCEMQYIQSISIWEHFIWNGHRGFGEVVYFISTKMCPVSHFNQLDRPYPDTYRNKTLSDLPFDPWLNFYICGGRVVSAFLLASLPKACWFPRRWSTLGPFSSRYVRSISYPLLLSFGGGRSMRSNPAVVVISREKSIEFQSTSPHLKSGKQPMAKIDPTVTLVMRCFYSFSGFLSFGMMLTC